ncbi:MAG: proprotein convertase P-domain-containing protein [Bradymonadaceae bacterium]
MNYPSTVANALFGIVALGLIGCGEAPEEIPSTPDGEEKSVDLAGKGDAWNWANRPEVFQTELEYLFEALPGEGYSQKQGFSDYYWATYTDAINYRWQGVNILSPAEKYDKAFNGWTPDDDFMDLKPYRGFESRSYSADDGCDWDKEYYQRLGQAANWVSNNKGNKRGRLHRDDVAEGERCGFGTDTGELNGVETWWGLCHATAPVAVLEDEPLKAVEHNGVTFEVGDIKALLTMEYDRSQSYFVGQRCNLRGDDIHRDEYGRIQDESCRNLNAGTFHVLMTNLLGIQNRMMVADIDGGYMVWNYPVSGYKVTHQRALTLEEANQLLNLEGTEYAEEYKYNGAAESFYEIKMRFDYIAGSNPSTQPNGHVLSRHTQNRNVHYLLELDAEGKIIGGEWLMDSIRNKPDFLWLPTRPSGSNPYVNIEQVRELVRLSRAEEDGDEPGIVTVSNDSRVAIPDNDPTGASSTINVSESGVLKGLTIDLKISHTYRGDLRVELRKGGVSVTLFNGLAGVERAWDDDVELTSEIVNGFEGLDIAGEWEIHVIDGMRFDTGHIESFTLNLEI